jgi:hypothetical protein
MRTPSALLNDVDAKEMMQYMEYT